MKQSYISDYIELNTGRNTLKKREKLVWENLCHIDIRCQGFFVLVSLLALNLNYIKYAIQLNNNSVGYHDND